MPDSRGRLGVLLLSFAGLGGQAHQKTMYVPALRDHPSLCLIAVADESDASLAQHALNAAEADALGLPYIGDLAAALADPRVDLVSVCGPLDRRVQVIERVAAAGKPMLVDKPLALTLDDCDAIERVTTAAGVACVPAHHYRFNAAVRAARAAVVDGSIGLPWAIHGEFIIAGGTGAWPLGELANFGLYPIDAMRAILGLEIESVYATSGAFFFDGAVDDFSVLTMTMQHGVIATTSVGRAPTRPHPHGYAGDRRFRLMGSHGTLVVDAAKPALQVYGQSSVGYGTDSLRGLVDHLIDSVRDGRAPEIGPADARAALEVTLAARRSAAENRIVHLVRRNGQ